MRWRNIYGVFIAFLQWITISVDGYKNFKDSLRLARMNALRGEEAERYQEPEDEQLESSSLGSEESSWSPSVSSTDSVSSKASGVLWLHETIKKEEPKHRLIRFRKRGG